VINVPWFSERQRFAAIAHSSFEAGLQLVGERAAHVETVHLFMALSRAAWFIHSPANWDEAEYYARAAVRVAEHLSEPAELSAALGILSEVYGSRGLFRERVDISLQRLALSHDSHFSNAHERAKILQEAGRALVHVGEYRQAIPYFVEAEQLAGQIQALKNQVFALRYLAHCWFRLDHWDGVLENEQRWRSLEERYANFIERSGPI
jgi:tetratricopeptide (TPR) repeat protein